MLDTNCEFPSRGSGTACEVFHVQRQGDTVIVMPGRTVDELEFDAVHRHVGKAVSLLQGSHVRHAVIDCRNVDRCCSTAIGCFITLSNKARDAGGRLVLCNLSDFMRVKLNVLQLDSVLPSCRTRSDALTALQAI
jgi:anti-anti-sigma factor